MRSLIPFGIYLSIKNTFKKSDKILDIIMDEPERLLEVRGIGESRAKLYQRKLLDNRLKWPL